MSEFRERPQLGDLSMRRISHYMGYLSRERGKTEPLADREVSFSAPEHNTPDLKPLYTGRGIPDPWDIIEEPVATPEPDDGSWRPEVSGEETAEPREETPVTNVSVFDDDDFSLDWTQGAESWDAFLRSGQRHREQVSAPVETVREAPEGLLTDDDLRRAMAILSESDDYLLSDTTNTHAVRVESSHASKVYENNSNIIKIDDYYDDTLERQHIRHRQAGIRILIAVLAVFFVLSSAGLAYLYFFTDMFKPSSLVVSAYEIFLNNESIGCVLDGQAVLDSIENDRPGTESDNGLVADPSPPVSMKPIMIEERFVAPESDMLEYIREYSSILVGAVSVYGNGCLMAVIGSESGPDSALKIASPPFFITGKTMDILYRRCSTDLRNTL